MKRRLASFVVLASSLCALRAPAAPPDDAPTLVIRGGRLFDPTTGTAREIGALFVRGETVLGERDASAPVPPGVPVVDATGCTILPGFFDLHVHVAVSGAGYSSRAFVAPEENLASHLACGVTNVVDLHGDERTIFALRDRSRTDPALARLHVAGGAFTAPGGHGTQFGVPANTVTTAAEVDARFEALLPKKPDVIKAIVEHGGWGGLGAFPALAPECLAAIGRRAKAAGLPLFVHVWSADEAKLAVASGARALAHGVFTGEAGADLAAAMKANGVAYVPTLAVVLASQRIAAGRPPYAKPLVASALHPDIVKALESADPATLRASPMAHPDLDGARALANLKALADAGVEIGLGTDAGNPLVPHGPATLFEMRLYVDAGLAPARALAAATLGSARILGVADRFGSLEPGKVADVVIVRGDPLANVDDVFAVEKVVKGGRLVDREAAFAKNRERARGARVLVAGAGAPVEIDGFDDGDLASSWGGTWRESADVVAPGGKSTAKLAVADGKLRVTGEVSQGFQWGAWSGVALQFDPDRKIVVDASRSPGLVIRARGTKRPYTLTVLREAVGDFNVFAAPVELGEEWREITVPFTAFRQIGFGKSIPWAANDVIGFHLEARNAPMVAGTFGPFEIEIDWIRLAEPVADPR